MTKAAETILLIVGQTSVRFFTPCLTSTLNGFELKPEECIIGLLYLFIVLLAINKLLLKMFGFSFFCADRRTKQEELPAQLKVYSEIRDD